MTSPVRPPVRTEALAALPVREAVPELVAALDAHGTAVLCAPPGTGKTTLVPLVLAGLVGGGPARKVIVAEPRRIAARAAARRMAWLLGEQTGASIGFTVRGERVVGPDTRVEVVTTGVLLQRLQRDQELAGTDVVVLDECHERHLDADTVAAFLLDVRETLRPELRLLAASATTDAAGWARLLRDAPVVEAAGTAHPVEVVWAPPVRPVRPPHGMRVDPALLTHVAAVVRRALAEREGDVLCFLPGVGEISRVAGQLGAVDAEVLQVHGRAPAAVQDAVLAGGTGRRRVILATAVAESSLTVPGVRIVVDAGLAREPRVDHARGLGALATVRSSRASARQRAGRAGREAPGAVYRCWPEAEHGRLVPFPSPEIRIADLAQFALQAACWGDPDATGLALLDPPPAGAMAAAREVLAAVDAVDPAGRLTARGRAMSRLGLHPRLARALLDGAAEVGPRRAAEVVALLSEEPPREYGDDLAAAWRQARRGADAYAPRWRTESLRLERAVPRRAQADPAPTRRTTAGPDPTRRPQAGPDSAPPAFEAPPEGTTTRRTTAGAQTHPRSDRDGDGGGGGALADDAVAGLITALAFPERVAQRKGDGAYLMASGTGADLGDGSRLRSAPWLAVAVADRAPHSPSARIRLAALIDEDTARAAAAHLLSSGEEVHWQGGAPGGAAGGDVSARSVHRLGAIELTVRPLRAPAPELVRAALLDGLRAEGLGLLRWTQDALALRARLGFLHRTLGEPWPDVARDDVLLSRADDWLEPELSRARRRADLGRIEAGQALNRLLPWATGQASRLDELAPERITVPSGSRIRVEYGDGQPVLAVKLQELFGLAATPRVAGVPVLVHLLSPAGRPAAVTADLASFWKDGYRAVRAELRGRYPRHPWPEDPATAEPTRHTTHRLRRS
ncbi:ATP-dependent helicase C-terminal domain-containing protein [Streptomyces sp. G-G2]|uniref:ATP-dependent RNA helicase n=1 Tax=Streptomyces sp. G-G2 TaxID=3046201 RepID=UPI0024BB2855|nr:ATP-dependent helicase C-terminal domain-containing protein [Streptomyces sp. G-G2]MDJ0381398.1 ATP-dependent helicase C-terminal domain-containing protein [Streptomyces sp. G-G2]